MSCRVITRLAIKDGVVARWAVSIGHRFPFAILLILIFSNSCNAQETTLWQPSFETDGMKSEIADRISDWKRWGFIDKNGTFVISPRYDLVKPFLEENTVVCIGDRYFKIDKTGKMIGHIMTRVEVISEANNKRWAGEATEKRRENRTKYNGEIYDATGNKRLGSASECELGTFSEGLASCALSHRRPPDSIGEAENKPDTLTNMVVWSSHRGSLELMSFKMELLMLKFMVTIGADMQVVTSTRMVNCSVAITTVRLGILQTD